MELAGDRRVGWCRDARRGFPLSTWIAKCQSDFHVERSGRPTDDV